ncbi:MAG: glycosyltransferase family 1 protein [Opitutae bacterium]|nr:glycosyltransferase family 1 protein [Opitutae bacterium]
MIKLLKASSYYPKYLRWFFARHPELRDASYAAQHAALMADGFSFPDAWKKTLEGTGEFSVGEIVINAEPLQRRWAGENGVSFADATWMRDIFLAQVEHFGPQLLYAHAHEVAYEWSGELKRRYGRRLPIACYDGIARHDPALTQHCDLLFSPVVQSVEFYRATGIRAELMQFGFMPDLLPRLDRQSKQSQVSFIGSLDVRSGHAGRCRLLGHIQREAPLDLWLSGLPSDRQLIRYAVSFARRGEWTALGRFPAVATTLRHLRTASQGELFGVAMYSALASSRITVNMHHDAAITTGQAGNIRLYEATGVGTCLLTDWKPNMPELFDVDREVVTYRNAEEAVEKIHYLLEHENERRTIAERGQRRTLNRYNYADEIRRIAPVLKDLLR